MPLHGGFLQMAAVAQATHIGPRIVNSYRAQIADSIITGTLQHKGDKIVDILFKGISDNDRGQEI